MIKNKVHPTYYMKKPQCMKRFYLTFLFLSLLGIQPIISQTNSLREPGEGEVAMITTGEGPTKEEATHVALRSAIEVLRCSPSSQFIAKIVI